MPKRKITPEPIDQIHPRVPDVAEKPFADMSLDEIFDVEQRHSANLGSRQRPFAELNRLVARLAAVPDQASGDAKKLPPLPPLPNLSDATAVAEYKARGSKTP